MGEILNNLKKWLESDAGKKDLDEWAAKMEFNNSLNQKYYDKLNAMSKKERKDLCVKIHNKYMSKKYLDKEYKISYEPRCELYYFLFEYALNYGEPYDNGKEEYFPTESYIIDDDIILEMIYGQGSFCTMYFKDNKDD